MWVLDASLMHLSGHTDFSQNSASSLAFTGMEGATMRKPGPIPPPQLLTPSRAPHSTKQLPAWGHHSGHAGCGFLASSGRWTPPLPQPGSDVHDQRKCLLLEFMFHIPAALEQAHVVAVTTVWSKVPWGGGRLSTRTVLLPISDTSSPQGPW